MNTNGYLFNPLGLLVLVVIGGGMIAAMWPLFSFFGTLTGTGWIGGLALGITIVLVAFIDVAREYAEHRERLPERP